MKVLAVEDNEIVGFLYQTMFKKLGIYYQIAKTAEEALNFYKKTKFDLVLCDFYLPDMNGFDLCEQLRKQKKENKVPIVLVSGDRDEILKDPKAQLFDDWLQ